jgi:type II secretion system protein N
MNCRRILAISALTVAALIIFSFLTILFVPSEKIKDVLVRGLQKNGYVFQSETFGKSFPLGFAARNILVSDERGTLLKLDRATLHVEFLPLFIGRVAIDFDAQIGEGNVQVEYMPKPAKLSFELNDILLENVPLLQVVTGANLKGRLFADGSFSGRGKKTAGELKMEIKTADLSAIKVGEMPLPDASYETIRGMFRAASGAGTLESLTFKGNGIYIRMKGTVPLSGPLASAPLALTIQLMPKPDFLEKQKLVFLLLAKYQTTPGSYQIPVKGVLMKPVIQ